MIQRIQSVWLFLAASCLVAVTFLPLGKFCLPGGWYEWTAFSLKATDAMTPMNLPVWLAGVLACAGALLSLVTLFSFKRRWLQLSLTRWNIVLTTLLTIGFLAVFVYFKYVLHAWIGIGFGALLPIIALVLLFLAQRGVHKDEELVRSWDRIR